MLRMRAAKYCQLLQRRRSGSALSAKFASERLDVPFTHAQHPGNIDLEAMLNPVDVAQFYWHTRLQSRAARSNEIELWP